MYSAHNCDLSDKCDKVTQEQMVNEESDFDQIPNPYDDEQLTMYEGKGAPGASMYYDKTVLVSDKMQEVIVSNSSRFGSVPIGPLYKYLPQSLHHLLPGAFHHSYVIHDQSDKAKFDDLFTHNKEHPASVIVVEKSEKLYEDVITDPESVETTVKNLCSLDPTLANLLIDYFEAHTWSKYACFVTVYRSYILHCTSRRNYNT